MNLNYGLSLTQEQKLVMTQEMQLSVKLLQMSAYELQEYVEKELEENPVLNEDSDMENNLKKEDIDLRELIKSMDRENYNVHSTNRREDDDEVSPFNFISEKKSLKEFLLEQIRYLNESNKAKAICSYIVENIDSRGYLSISIGDIVDDLNISSFEAEYALHLVQNFEPVGIAARNLKECLKIQIHKKGIENDYIYKIIDEHLEHLADNRYSLISKELGIDTKKAQEFGDVIKSLNPKPASGFYTGESVNYIIPDAYIKRIDDEFYIVMNDDLTPRLSINEIYKEILKEDCDKDACNYVKDKLNSALFLIKSIQHRKTTIYKVLEKILAVQEEYFKYGRTHLKPMTLKEVADELGIHESTVSRAIRDKYIYTERGTIKIKDLFTSKISSNCEGEELSSINIKQKIKNLIEEEDKKNPLSDQVISDILNKEGMSISRRTVAKYREEIGIKSSKGRKRF